MKFYNWQQPGHKDPEQIVRTLAFQIALCCCLPRREFGFSQERHMPYDLFISYSRRDNEQGRITQLVNRIKADFATFTHRELVPFFDQNEIHGMSDWRQRILQGLRESRLLLACLSPTYLRSEYCEWEFVEYLKYEIGQLHGFNGVAPIYFVQVPGWDDTRRELKKPYA
ncbi:MAG TPA: toll/interleukin-1 receptor domain-containing protein [Planctomycetaceae bacterium]|nr:toll/interleukin-1 receptor domain-containing protein [Planctomycetaceae bacterium]